MGLGLPGERAGSDARYSSSLFPAPRHAVLAEGARKPAQALLLMAGLMATVYAIKTGLKSDGAWWLSLVIGCIGTAMLARFVRIQLRSTHAMLDMSLFSKPAIRMGVVMALVVMGSLAGVELLLAQELQFVTGRSPLEAGLFMLPLMAASAVGGPLAGLILRAVGLRLVATGSLALATISIAGLAYSDFNNAGFGVAVLMVGLGLALGVGLTASSVAIMSSAPEEKAGSAGAPEATSYDRHRIGDRRVRVGDGIELSKGNSPARGHSARSSGNRCSICRRNHVGCSKRRRAIWASDRRGWPAGLQHVTQHGASFRRGIDRPP